MQRICRIGWRSTTVSHSCIIDVNQTLLVELGRLPQVEVALAVPEQLHTSLRGAMTFTPDAKMLITGSRDRTIKLSEMPQVIEKKSLTGHTGWIRSLAVSPDGKVLVSASDDQTIKFWDLDTGRNFRTLKDHTGAVRCVTFSPDGKRLASASWDRTIKLWEGGVKAEEWSQVHDHPISVGALHKFVKYASSYPSTLVCVPPAKTALNEP